MIKPRNLQPETEEMKAIKEPALKAFFDEKMPASEANKIIEECNTKLSALGLQKSQHIALRS